MSDDAEQPAGPRRRDAAATRQALLQAAHSRFVRLGYDRTTLRDVAADVGVNLALIKRYFDSKEGLFKAALATAPRFLDDDGGFPADRTALAAVLSRQLAGDVWPEFGEHPVLMLLRVSGDERVDSLRRQALHDFSRQVLAAAGQPAASAAAADQRPAASDAAMGQGVSHDDASPSSESAEELLRAQLLVALGVGVAVLRSAVGLQPLRDATAEELAGPLREVVDALLSPPPASVARR